MKLEQYRTMWGVIDETDGSLARSPVHTIEEAVTKLASLVCHMPCSVMSPSAMPLAPGPPFVQYTTGSVFGSFSDSKNQSAHMGEQQRDNQHPKRVNAEHIHVRRRRRYVQ